MPSSPPPGTESLEVLEAATHEAAMRYFTAPPEELAERRHAYHAAIAREIEARVREAVGRKRREASLSPAAAES